jgi:biotin carboxyl carrier protein
MRQRYTAQVGPSEFRVEVEAAGDGVWQVVVDGRAREVDVHRLPSGAYSLLVGTRAHLVEVDGRSPELTVHLGDGPIGVRLMDDRQRLAALSSSRRAASGPAELRAPMPGRVVKVLLAPGAPVAAGQGVVVVEAMKMENELRAPRPGTLAAVAVREGQAVEAGQVLATVE